MRKILKIVMEVCCILACVVNIGVCGGVCVCVLHAQCFSGDWGNWNVIEIFFLHQLITHKIPVLVIFTIRLD